MGEGFFLKRLRWVMLLGTLALMSGFAPRTAHAGAVGRRTLGAEAKPLPVSAQAVKPSNSTNPPQAGAAPTCPTPCGPDYVCADGRCVCALGRGGPTCAFSFADIYFTDYITMYAGLREDPLAFRPLDMQVSGALLRGVTAPCSRR